MGDFAFVRLGMGDFREHDCKHFPSFPRREMAGFRDLSTERYNESFSKFRGQRSIKEVISNTCKNQCTFKISLRDLDCVQYRFINSVNRQINVGLIKGPMKQEEGLAILLSRTMHQST